MNFHSDVKNGSVHIVLPSPRRAARSSSFCYGARTSGRGPGGETPRVADSSAAGAGRVFLNSIPRGYGTARVFVCRIAMIFGSASKQAGPKLRAGSALVFGPADLHLEIFPQTRPRAAV